MFQFAFGFGFRIVIKILIRVWIFDPCLNLHSGLFFRVLSRVFDSELSNVTERNRVSTREWFYSGLGVASRSWLVIQNLIRDWVLVRDSESTIGVGSWFGVYGRSFNPRLGVYSRSFKSRLGVYSNLEFHLGTQNWFGIQNFNSELDRDSEFQLGNRSRKF